MGYLLLLLHETLCVLFIEIQKPWAMHCPANRATHYAGTTYKETTRIVGTSQQQQQQQQW